MFCTCCTLLIYCFVHALKGNMYIYYVGLLLHWSLHLFQFVLEFGADVLLLLILSFSSVTHHICYKYICLFKPATKCSLVQKHSAISPVFDSLFLRIPLQLQPQMHPLWPPRPPNTLAMTSPAPLPRQNHADDPPHWALSQTPLRESGKLPSSDYVTWTITPPKTAPAPWKPCESSLCQLYLRERLSV